MIPTYSGYYRDCKDAFEQGQNCNGLYTIKPENTSDRLSVLAHPPFQVYCDMKTDGGGVDCVPAQNERNCRLLPQLD